MKIRKYSIKESFFDGLCSGELDFYVKDLRWCPEPHPVPGEVVMLVSDDAFDSRKAYVVAEEVDGSYATFALLRVRGEKSD